MTLSIRNRSNNKFYCDQLETNVVNLLQGKPYQNYFNLTGLTLTDAISETERISDAIKNFCKLANIKIKTVERIGQFTTTEDGDIKINGVLTVELKSTADDSFGTHYNATIDCIKNILPDFPTYEDFLLEHGFYEKLPTITKIPFTKGRTIFDKAHRRLLSSRERSQIKELESPICELYVSKVFDEIKRLHKEEQFMNYFLQKGNRKHLPDVLIASHRNAKTISTYKKEDLQSLRSSGKIRKVGKSIVFPGVCRIQFGWQNGTGLDNPTIRTFLQLSER